jgi:thiosulfate reductase cytochrome b subunit
MDIIPTDNLQLIMLIFMFVLGSLTFIIGVAILVTGAWRRDIRSITSQTARLAQKGIAEEVSGLIGNAAALLDTLNGMVKTATGIGVLLIVSGGLLMSVSCWFIFKLNS